MADLKSVVAEKLPLTMGETIALAKEYGVRVVDVVLTESELRTGLDREGVLKAVMEEYAHTSRLWRSAFPAETASCSAPFPPSSRKWAPVPSCGCAA